MGSQGHLCCFLDVPVQICWHLYESQKPFRGNGQMDKLGAATVRLDLLYCVDGMRQSMQLNLIPPYHFNLLFGWKLQHWRPALKWCGQCGQSRACSVMCGCCILLRRKQPRLDFLRSEAFLPLKSLCCADSAPSV